MQLYMVFDVESIGLHGEGFAVGYVVVNELGTQQDSGLYACPFDKAIGSPEGREWVTTNCRLDWIPTHELTSEIRTAFWHKWQQWKDQGALLVADCCWPVEARFLAACVDDDPQTRQWQGPYPLHDLASVLLAHGRNPIAKYDRHEDELPEHNPKADARQSARILIATLSLG